MRSKQSITHEWLGFPEGLRWRDGFLYLSDFVSRRVLRLDGAGHLEALAFVHGQPSGLGFTPGGDLLVVSMFENRLLRIGADGMEIAAELRSLSIGPSNDLIVDGLGRSYVGCMGYNAFLEPPTALRPVPLCLVDADGAVRVAAQDLVFPNGMVFLDDEATLVVAETYAHRLTAFSVAGDGQLVDRRVLVSLGDRSPDGMCVTRGGDIWVACPSHQQVVRISEDHVITDMIEFPGRMPVCCAVDGERETTLFVATTGPGDGGTGPMVGTIELVALA